MKRLPQIMESEADKQQAAQGQDNGPGCRQKRARQKEGDKARAKGCISP
jgi:hypothetical protein